MVKAKKERKEEKERRKRKRKKREHGRSSVTEKIRKQIT